MPSRDPVLVDRIMQAVSAADLRYPDGGRMLFYSQRKRIAEAIVDALPITTAECALVVIPAGQAIGYGTDVV